MQKWVEWWCSLIGIIDPAAISVSIGVVGGGLGLLAAYYALMAALAVVGLFYAMVRDN